MAFALFQLQFAFHVTSESERLRTVEGHTVYLAFPVKFSHSSFQDMKVCQFDKVVRAGSGLLNKSPVMLLLIQPEIDQQLHCEVHCVIKQKPVFFYHDG